MRRLIGNAVLAACRVALRVVWGIRIPAARIRLHDQQRNREHAAEQLFLSKSSATYWANELQRIDADLADAEAALLSMEHQQQRLRLPDPTGPISFL